MLENILYVNACLRQNSRTNELACRLLNSLDGKITEIKLYEENVSPIDNTGLAKRDSGDFSALEFQYAKQFAAADTIVIAAPFWDLSFPSVLKVYFENVTVSGLTFEYSEKGIPFGKCSAKRLYYVTTSGGYIGENNFGFEYVKALAKNFYGIDDVRFYSAEGLDIWGNDPRSIMDEAKEKITKER